MSDLKKTPRRSNFRRAAWGASLLLAELAATTLGFSEIVLLRPKKDATLLESANGALANGSGPAIFSGRTSAGTESIRRALLAFDVGSMIPPGSTVSKVVLSLNLSATSAGPVAINLQRVTAEWGEGTSVSSGGGGAPSAEGDSTWLHRFYENSLWTQPGGDFDATVLSTATVDQPGLYLWDTNAAMVAEVQAWLDHPENNHGWILVGDETHSTTVKRFDSRESPDEANRPVLYVEYSPPCTPDPLGPGAWSRHCSVLLGDAPSLPEEAAGGPEVPGFAENVLPCAQAMLVDLGIPDASPCGALAPSAPRDCVERAVRNLSVLALNVCASRLQTSCEVAGKGPACGAANVGELVQELADSILSGDCGRGSDCADAVN